MTTRTYKNKNIDKNCYNKEFTEIHFAENNLHTQTMVNFQNFTELQYKFTETHIQFRIIMNVYKITFVNIIKFYRRKVVLYIME